MAEDSEQRVEGEPTRVLLTSDYEDGADYVDAATRALTYTYLPVQPGPSLVVGAPKEVTPRSLRDAMGSLATGVCVVTTVLDGRDVAMTANSVTSVSLDPPLILFCVVDGSRFADAVIAEGRWGVSVLDATAYELSSHFARPGRSHDTQFDHIRHHRGPATGIALLDPSVAELECLTVDTHVAGDHVIVVGRVVALEQRGESAHPLVFHRGRYRWLL